MKTSTGIVLIGPSLESKGGISSVMRQHMDQSAMKQRIHHIPSYLGESVVGDILIFALCLLRTIWIAMTSFRHPVLFHIHTSSGTSFFRKSLIARIARFFRCPYLLHVHAGDMDTYLVRSGLKRATAIFKNAAAVIVLSDEWRTIFKQMMPTLENLHVLPNPAPSGCFELPVKRKASALTRLLFTGFLIEEKGCLDLIRAMSLVTQGNWSLDMFGDGDKEQICRLIEDLGMQDQITVHGWVNLTNPSNFYVNYDIFVLPSEYEGMPMSVLEAMSCGLPIIGTNIVGLRNCVQHGTNGLLVDCHQPEALATAIGSLLQNQDLLQEMGRASVRITRESFSLRHIVSRLDELYGQLLNGYPLTPNR